MEYAFIINPISGSGQKARRLVAKVRKMAEKNPHYRCYVTAGEKDATVLAGMIAEEAERNGRDVIVYACGGDGTIQETAIGLLGREHVRLGVIPIGSGNDFVRSFDEPGAFEDPARQRSAKPKRIDMLRYTWTEGDKVRTGYAVNGINIGFDGNTAILAHSLKEVPMVQGTASYALAIIVNLIRKKGANLRVTADGKPVYDGPLIMCTAANGRFCGGGVESCPRARMDNGKIELLVVGNISRRYFLKVFPKFKSGRVFEIPDVQRHICSLQAGQVKIEPAGGTMKFVADGEILETGALTVDVIPGALTVMVP